MFFVTGANGFLGRALIKELATLNYSVRGSTRANTSNKNSKVEIVRSPFLVSSSEWADLLKGCEFLIHTAARVHIMNDHSTDALAQYREINTEATLNLARQAVNAGIKRFVYISSIKVNGEFTRPGEKFTSSSLPNPQDPYSISKWEAELGLKEISKVTGLDVVIVRPPLIYGPGVKGNFLNLIKAIERGALFPLASINNSRSLVGLGNCIDLIIKATISSNPGFNTFLVSDDSDLSTPELIKRLAKALDRSAKLFPIPEFILSSGARFVGKSQLAQRLLSSLEIDILETKHVLNWVPPFDIDTELRKIAYNLSRNDIHLF